MRGSQTRIFDPRLARIRLPLFNGTNPFPTHHLDPSFEPISGDDDAPAQMKRRKIGHLGEFINRGARNAKNVGNLLNRKR